MRSLNDQEMSLHLRKVRLNDVETPPVSARLPSHSTSILPFTPSILPFTPSILPFTPSICRLPPSTIRLSCRLLASTLRLSCRFFLVYLAVHTRLSCRTSGIHVMTSKACLHMKKNGSTYTYMHTYIYSRFLNLHQGNL